MTLFIVKASFDSEAGVWFVSDSDIPGLVTEAPSFDDLCRKIRIIASELLELNGWDSGEDVEREVPIEVIAHASGKVKLVAA